MAKQRKSDRITVANVGAILGLVLLFAFTFIGHSFLNGGEIAKALVVATGITLVAAFFLWFLLTAKGAENQLDKWRIIEYSTLATYILFAIVSTCFSGVLNFFNVNSQKTEVQAKITKVKSDLGSLIDDFTTFEEDALNLTSDGLKEALENVMDERLKKFITDSIPGDSATVLKIETYINTQRDNLYGSPDADADGFRSEMMSSVDRFMGPLDSWNVLKIAFQVNQIKGFVDEMGSNLTNRSKEAYLPIVGTVEEGVPLLTYLSSCYPFQVNQIKGFVDEMGSNLTNRSKEAYLPIVGTVEEGVYTIIQDNQTKEFSILMDDVQLSEVFRKPFAFTFWGVVVVLLVHLLILFNYIVGYRTSVMGKRKVGVNDGGRIL